MIKDLKDIFEVVGRLGIVGFILIIVILLILDPTRVEKIQVAVLTPFYRFWRWGSRQYLAKRVGLSVSEFYRHQIGAMLSSASRLRFKIRWVTTSKDPILTRRGTLILRLEETDDQTHNILSATKIALAKTVCPTLRSQIKAPLENAIDLVLLRKLTERLGKHAHPIFVKHFLEPQTKDDAQCAILLGELIDIDHAGLFVAIFLEELTLLGDYAFSQNDWSDKTESIRQFLQFLLEMARRKEFEEVELDHFSEDFRVGIILLAKTQRAATQGVTPYVKRINRRIREACDSIYVIAYKPAIRFQDHVVRAVREDARISVGKISTIPVKATPDRRSGAISIAQLRISRAFEDATFEKQLNELGFAVGDSITGKIIDVADQVALVNVNGVTGSITRGNCAWTNVSSCCDMFAMGQEVRFQIASFDHARGMLVLSRRFEDEDPLQLLGIPNVGDELSVKVISIDNEGLIGRRHDGLEIQIPFSEISWMHEGPDVATTFLDEQVTALIYETDLARRILRGSLRKLSANPWPAIHTRFPAGTRVRGTVVEVDTLLHFVRVEIADDIRGIIPAESMVAAGYEYRDFEDTLILGQKLDVVVTKVFINRRKIRLDLQRNLPLRS